MSAEAGIVIVGGGPTAQAAAGAYREAGGRLSLTILAAEHEAPYQRPPLTKEFLRGELVRAELALQPLDWYRERDIELALDERVEALDLEVGEARTEDGRRWPFRRCLLATGARPLVPEIPGVAGPDVRLVRAVGDSEQLKALTGQRVLVVGSGFVGCEAAASLAMVGARVTVATLEAGPQVDRLGSAVSERIAGWLEGQGVEIEAGVALAEIVADPSGALARFEDGREQLADAVVLALGVTRNDELAAAAGVAVDDGVLVDAAMVSSNPCLLAAGDVACAENVGAGRRLRVEHWGEALNMGEVAGRTLAGADASWGVVPGFWSTIGGRTLKYAGWGDGWDEVRFETGVEGSFAAWYGREGELVGVAAHDDDAAYEEGRQLIEARAPWS
ncbi:MAG: NAD(P)/FAD-dependent oxidoreductase [Solirubrobacterales bacterium]